MAKNLRNPSTMFERCYQTILKGKLNKIVGRLLLTLFWVIFIIILCFEPRELVFLIKIVLHAMKQIPDSGRTPGRGGGWLTREVTGCAANLSTSCTLSHKKWHKSIQCFIKVLPKSLVSREIEKASFHMISCRIIFLSIVIPCRMTFIRKGHPAA